MLFESIKQMNTEQVKNVIRNNSIILFEMIEQKNQDRVIWNKIISADPNILNNMHPKLLHPLFHHAMKHHEYDTVCFLLDYSDKINHLNGDAYYNYHFLTEVDKDTDIVAYKNIYNKFQKNHPTDVKSIISDVGDNLLSNAILNNNYEVVKFYKELGIDPNQKTQHENALFALVDTYLINSFSDESYIQFIENTIKLFQKNDVSDDTINDDNRNFFEAAWENNPVLVDYILKYKTDMFKEQIEQIENKLEKNKRVVYSYLPRQSCETLLFFENKINWDYNFGKENILDFFAMGFYSNPKAFSYFVKNMSDFFNNEVVQERIMLKFTENQKQYNKESMEKFIIPEFKLITEDPELLRRIIVKAHDKTNKDLIESLEFILANTEKKSLNRILDSENNEFKANSKPSRI